MNDMMLHTRNLIIAPASPDDIDSILSLWNDPAVMRAVGYPEGLGVNRNDILGRLRAQQPAMLDYLLTVKHTGDGAVMGQAMMHAPSEGGISDTDIKLFPNCRHRGYGTEVKHALIHYLFTKTACRAVQATPNLSNIPSIRMQESVGAIRLGRGRCQFPDTLRVPTCPVDYWLYRRYKAQAPFTDIRHRRFNYAAVVPAAGRSSRMGRMKQLLPWPPGTRHAMTVIESTVNSLILAGCDPVIVITGHAGDRVRQRLDAWPVQCADNPDPSAPMGTSVSLGAMELQTLLSKPEYQARSTAVLLLPGDHPGVAPDTIRTLIESHEIEPGTIHLPEHNGRTGHPALFPPAATPYLLKPDPDHGLRALIHSDIFSVHRHPLQDPGVHKNLDYPDDYQAD